MFPRKIFLSKNDSRALCKGKGVLAAHSRQVVVIQYVDLDGEIVVRQVGDVERGCVGHAGVVPEDDPSMARPGAETRHCQDLGVTDVRFLQQQGRALSFTLACLSSSGRLRTSAEGKTSAY